jgi:hypothetical protein
VDRTPRAIGMEQMRRVFGSGLEDISAHEAARVQERAFRSLRRYPQTIGHLETTGRARQDRTQGEGCACPRPARRGTGCVVWRQEERDRGDLREAEGRRVRADREGRLIRGAGDPTGADEAWTGVSDLEPVGLDWHRLVVLTIGRRLHRLGARPREVREGGRGSTDRRARTAPGAEFMWE